MNRIAAPMVGGLVTSFVLELLVYPAIFAIWKGGGLPLGDGAVATIRATEEEREETPIELTATGGAFGGSRRRW